VTMQRLVPCLVAAIAALGCSGGTGFVYEPARAELLRETVDVVIVPGYRAAADAATTLVTRTTELCDGTPDAAGVEAARTAWRGLFLAWERTSAFRFGPVQTLNIGDEIAFHPTRPTVIEDNVAQTVPVDDAWIETLGAAGLGIFALEYLLHEPADTAAVASALEASPRRCEYLMAAARDTARLATEAHDAWVPYGEALATAATEGNTTFPSQLRALSTLLTQIVGATTLMKSARLGVPLGDNTGGTPQPGEVRSPYAHLSNEGMLAELDGVRATWTAGVEGRGLSGYLAMRNATLAETVLAQMSATRAAIDAVPDPLESYVVMPEHPLATEAQLEVRTLERTLGTDVSVALSVSVMFTDADGD
jgi:uncharacterized protein